MDLVELNELLAWIDEHVKSAGIQTAYETLRDVLQSNAQGGQQQPIQPQKDALIEAVESPPIDLLSQEQSTMLDRMEIGSFVGSRAVAMIEDVLFRNALDIPTAAQRMDEAAQAVARGIERKEKVEEGLTGIIEVGDRVPSGVLIRITFTHEAAIANVTDLKDWSDRWHDIARGIAMLHDRAPEDVIVVGASRGSLILDLSVNATIIATTLTAILLRALQVAERVVGIKMKAQELRTMQLRNDQIAQDLEAEARQEKDSATEAIVNELVQEHGVDGSRRGDKIPALQKSVQELLAFLERGGEVDCILPPEDEAAESEGAEASEGPREQLDELRSAVHEIRRLENRIRALEAGEPPPED